MANATVLPDDYDGLKKEYLVLRVELDSVNQELYVCKRQLKVVEALQLEYQSEIEILQSEEQTQKIKQDEKVAQLEENINNIRSKCNERVQGLESELSSKDEEIQKLKAEIDVLKKTNAADTPNEDVNKLLDELTSLKSQNEILLENEEELKLSIEILQKKCFSLEEALMEYKEELSNLKESLSCKRDELIEANDLVQKLNDELFCIRNELETYKSKPLNAETKGNSLFAEVDDRRVYLQQTINSMKSQYISMKQERAKHLNTISHLKKENKTLCERWKADMEDKEDDEHMVIKAYKDQIHILENLVEKYKRDLAAKPVVFSTGTFDEFEFYQNMLNNKSKELEELREQLKSRGLTNTILSTALKEANKEVRKWRLEATLKQCQLELQPGDSFSESALTQKIDAEIEGPRTELKQTKMGPHLACKKEENDDWKAVTKQEQNVIDTSTEVKEIIVLNDSSDDVEVVENANETLETPVEAVEQKPSPSILKNSKQNIIKTEIDETEYKTKHLEEFTSSTNVKVEPSNENSEEKENVAEKTSRRVTFCQGTVSPKATDRSALRANCKRIIAPKPIFIPSE